MSTLCVLGAPLVAVAITSLASAQQWQPAQPMPAPKAYAAGVADGSAIYPLGGSPWTPADMDGSCFVLQGSVWTQCAPLDGLGPMVQIAGARDALGRIIFTGGVSVDNGDIGPTRVYLPLEGTGPSLAAAPSSLAPEGFGSTVDAQSRLYRAGGKMESGAITGSVARYDAIANSWQQLPALAIAVAQGALACDATGRLMMIGGVTAAGTISTVQDLVSGTAAWSSSSIPPLPVKRSGARAIRGADDRIYLIGGRDESGQARAEVFALHPQQFAWTQVGSLAVARTDFAVALGADSHIHVMGGRDAAGVERAEVERLYTPACPAIAPTPDAVELWAGMPLYLEASATGGAPFSYQWFHDGVALVDGPTSPVGEVIGSQGATLVLTAVAASDAGDYSVRVSNACGESTALRAVVSVRMQGSIPTVWTAQNLHPAGAVASYAYAVDGGIAVGSYSTVHPTYGWLEQAAVWDVGSAQPLTVTPASSVGAAILDISASRAVGWWWWPYQCYVSGTWYTCYSRQAALWDLSTGLFSNLQVPGWEYSTAATVDGQLIGGSATNDDAVGNMWSHAMVWGLGSQWGRDVHPGTSTSSGISDISGGGFVGSAGHATRWEVVPPNSWQVTDLHPGGASASAAVTIDGELCGGWTGWPYDGARAAIWSGSGSSHVDLHPAGAALSHVRAIDGGMVLGDATINGVTQAGWYMLATRQFVPISGLAVDGFTDPAIADMEVAIDGSITVVGSATRVIGSRREAFRWRGVQSRAGDIDHSGAVDALDLAALLSAWGSSGAADIDGDGQVDAADLTILLTNWG